MRRRSLPAIGVALTVVALMLGGARCAPGPISEPADVRIWLRYEKLMLAAGRRDDAVEARHVLRRLGVEPSP